jgi:hypothetical protein
MTNIEKCRFKYKIDEELWEVSYYAMMLVSEIDKIKLRVSLNNAYEKEIDYRSIIAKIIDLKEKLNNISDNEINDLKESIDKKI